MADIVLSRYLLSERAGVDGELVVVNIRTEVDVRQFEPEGRVRNTLAAQDVTLPITIPSTANVDAGWARPRGVIIAWTGDPPMGYKPDGRLFVPIYTPARFDSYQVGLTGTFRGSSFIIVGKRPEVIRS